MADIKQLERALINADAAGDADAARALAGEIRKMRSAPKTEPAAAEPSLMSDIAQGAGNLVAGAVRGAGSIGATILAPYDMAKDALDGKGWSLESNRQRRAGIDGGLQLMGAQPDSLAYRTGKLGGEIAGTAGVGPALGIGAKAAGAAPSIVNALSTAGFRAGSTPGVANMLTRMAGGAVTGGTMAGVVDPEQAASGALVGGLLPPALAGIGRVGGAVGERLSTTVPEGLRQTAAAARNAGYVIPPTQVRPTMTNRLLEGFAGKASTAQNASARNQSVTNKLAMKAIGADDLTPEALGKVRAAANAAYDELGSVGAFQTDDAFRQALQKAGSISGQMRKDFPELVNAEVDDLVNGLAGREGFDAQSAIEAIKQFRFNGSANRAAMDPSKKALGKAQMQIAGALEDLIDRNLQASGQQSLLKNYRAARQTLAKVYDVEKALNTASGNVDAKKLGSTLAKGRPMTGELKQIAEFANQFPKAAQMTERIGSMPQVSPLDFGAMGALSAATSNPMLMAGVLARPAARSLVLAGPVQNRLATQQGGNRLMQLLANPTSEQLAFRAAPVAVTSR